MIQIYKLIETLKSIQKQKENKMALLTAKDLATKLNISTEQFNQFFDTVQDEGLFSGYQVGNENEVIDENDQEILLAYIENYLDNAPQEETKMPNQLLIQRHLEQFQLIGMSGDTTALLENSNEKFVSFEK